MSLEGIHLDAHGGLLLRLQGIRCAAHPFFDLGRRDTGIPCDAPGGLLFGLPGVRALKNLPFAFSRQEVTFGGRDLGSCATRPRNDASDARGSRVTWVTKEASNTMFSYQTRSVSCVWVKCRLARGSSLSGDGD